MIAYDNLSLALSLGEPVIRSDTYNIYLKDTEVIYANLKCDEADIAGRFFLHIVPANVADLPAGRQQYGFHNIDFRFADADGTRIKVKASRSAGRCRIAIPLRDYPIVSIRAGQYIPVEKDHRLWEGEYRFGE